MYMYLAEFTGTDKTLYLTPCETDLISLLWCWAHYELITSGSHWIKHMDVIYFKTEYTGTEGQYIHQIFHRVQIWSSFKICATLWLNQVYHNVSLYSPISAPTLIKYLEMRKYWCRISGQITLHLRKKLLNSRPNSTLFQMYWLVCF